MCGWGQARERAEGQHAGGDLPKTNRQGFTANPTARAGRRLGSPGWTASKRVRRRARAMMRARAFVTASQSRVRRLERIGAGRWLIRSGCTQPCSVETISGGDCMRAERHSSGPRWQSSVTSWPRRAAWLGHNTNAAAEPKSATAASSRGPRRGAERERVRQRGVSASASPKGNRCGEIEGRSMALTRHARSAFRTLFGDRRGRMRAGRITTFLRVRAWERNRSGGARAMRTLLQIGSPAPFAFAFAFLARGS